jgi:hypothetical protein
MKEVVNKSYVCEICGGIYPEAASALECEKQHDTTGRIKSMTYKAGEEIPNPIEVEFKDWIIVYCATRREKRHD